MRLCFQSRNAVGEKWCLELEARTKKKKASRKYLFSTFSHILSETLAVSSSHSLNHSNLQGYPRLAVSLVCPQMALSAAHAACVRQLSLRLHTLIRTRSCRHSGLMTSSSVPAHLRGLVLRQASSGAATPVTPTAATRTIWQPRISRAWLCGPTSGSVVQSHARAPDGPAAARVCDTGLPEPLGVLVARVSPGEDVTVVGWVRHVRRQKRVAFATVSDGSAGGTLQVRTACTVSKLRRCIDARCRVEVTVKECVSG